VKNDERGNRKEGGEEKERDLKDYKQMTFVFVWIYKKENDLI
jgi:hypothetical protein